MDHQKGCMHAKHGVKNPLNMTRKPDPKLGLAVYCIRSDRDTVSSYSHAWRGELDSSDDIAVADTAPTDCIVSSDSGLLA